MGAPSPLYLHEAVNGYLVRQSRDHCYAELLRSHDTSGDMASSNKVTYIRLAVVIGGVYEWT